MTSQSTEEMIQAKGLTAPRITPADLEAQIISEHYLQQSDAFIGENNRGAFVDDIASLDCLTICVLVLRNGFTIVGKSACASPANFDAELGRKIARDDAVKQIWPLEGYQLRTKLAAAV